MKQKENYFIIKIKSTITVFLLISILVVSLASCKNKSHVHTIEMVTKVDATCTTNGYNAHYKCFGCNKLFTDASGKNETVFSALKINALGHNLIHHAKVETTTQAGTIEYWSCSKCGNYFSDKEGYNHTTEITSPYNYVDESKTSLYFGTYPQTKVTNQTLISNLNVLAGTLPTSSNYGKWIDYGYFSNPKSSYMYYIDIDQNNDGVNDYRGVYFTERRPYYAYKKDNYSEATFANIDEYGINTVYWFKYEPIKWNILKTENNKALILSDLILDSQDYNIIIEPRKNIIDYQGNSPMGTIYENNYMYSNIRSWLNIKFYPKAFSKLGQQMIETTLVDNSTPISSYGCSNTNDKMFLLSYQEVDTYYSSSDVIYAQGTDYAKNQGLYVSSYYVGGNSCYWLRTPSYNDEAYYITEGGSSLEQSGNVGYSNIGVRPACWINL